MHVSICCVGSPLGMLTEFCWCGVSSVCVCLCVCAVCCRRRGTDKICIWCVCPHDTCLECGIHKTVHTRAGDLCISIHCVFLIQFVSATLSFVSLALCLVLCLVLFPFPCVILWVIWGHLFPLVRAQAPSRPPGPGLAGPRVQPAVATRRLTALTHAW